MPPLPSLLAVLLSVTVFFLHHYASASASSTVGVTYTLSSPSAPAVNTTVSFPPDRIAETIGTLKIPAVRIPDPTPEAVRAFLYSNTSLLLSIPNSLIPSIALNRSMANAWLFRHVIPFHPRVHISAISVGNNALEFQPDAIDLIMPAIRNIDSGLRDLGIHHISVSTTFSFISIMTGAFPPSSATFEEPVATALIRPLLMFLKDTNSSFMVNIYPYNLYRLRCEMPVGFALFQNEPFMYRDDLTTGARYWNIFDMMVDSVVAAMAVAGHEGVPIIVAETGWPSYSSDRTEIDANPDYAQMYIKGLILHLKSGIGTPLRREGVAETYIYELADKEIRHVGRNWGILFPNLTSKYEQKFEFSCAGRPGIPDTVLGLLVMVSFLLWILWYVPSYPD